MSNFGGTVETRLGLILRLRSGSWRGREGSDGCYVTVAIPKWFTRRVDCVTLETRAVKRECTPVPPFLF
jgi:hypothetical protein